ncbi:MAG TPA: chromate efflux transporter [Thermoanaerobaculia bacterium]|nr:chromate efflux transporter [Thermoanaerobaculia bacterium]
MSARPPPSLRQMFLYFLRLGAIGFGGPVALANAIRKDLVEQRQWLTEEEYDDGLAIAAACPGPLAYQLGVYCGYVRHRVTGGLAVAAAFGLAPFAIVVAAAWAYTRLAATWQLRGLFYGVAPVVVALILKACWNLGRKTLKSDVVAWVFFALACAITVVVQKELTAIFLVAGALGVFLFRPRPPAASRPPGPPQPAPAGSRLPAMAFFAGGAASGMNAKLFLFFFKTGLLVFGSGLVIVPFLKSYVVDQYHWLSNREFLDSVAIGMISPGPVVITATFVGYLLAGLPGALAATLGIFSPAVLFTVFATPLLLRYRGNRWLSGFIRGVTVAVVGVLAGTTYLVGRTADGDTLTVAVALASLAVLIFAPRLPEPLLVGIGALIGLIAYPILRPGWVLG